MPIRCMHGHITILIDLYGKQNVKSKGRLYSSQS